MIFVGGVVTVEGNGTQPVDVQTAVFRPEDTRLAVRLETVAGPVQPYRDERQRQFAPGGVVHRLRQAVVAVADAAVQPVAVEDGNRLIQRAAGNGGEIQPRRTVGRGYLIEAVRTGDAGEADLFVAVEPAAGSKSSSSKVASPSSSSMSGSGISRPCSSNADRTEAV